MFGLCQQECSLSTSPHTLPPQAAVQARSPGVPTAPQELRPPSRALGPLCCLGAIGAVSPGKGPPSTHHTVASDTHQTLFGALPAAFPVQTPSTPPHPATRWPQLPTTRQASLSPWCAQGTVLPASAQPPPPRAASSTPPSPAPRLSALPAPPRCPCPASLGHRELQDEWLSWPQGVCAVDAAP